MRHNLHHQHLRKRAQKLHKSPYPHPHPWVHFLDELMLVLAVLGPAINIPQIWQIFSTQNAGGLSLLAWILYTLLAIPWLIYGIVHKETPIIVANILWIITDIIIVYGIILYA